MQDILRVGNVEILSVSDGDIEFATPLSEICPDVPAHSWGPYLERYPDVFATPTTWRVHVGCYLLRSSGETFLVDTGLGPEPNSRFIGTSGVLLADLKRKGIDPGTIDTVFLTHSHGDHIGWNLRPGGHPVFPNARFIMSRVEWEWIPERISSGAPGMAAAAQQVLPLDSLKMLDLLEGETKLTDEITAIPTPGHTPGHMSLIVSSQGERACITGDAIVHPAQFTEPDWRVRMDFDSEAAAMTRHSLLDRFEAENLTVVSCHFPRPGYGQLIRFEGRRFWQAK